MRIGSARDNRLILRLIARVVSYARIHNVYRNALRRYGRPAAGLPEAFRRAHADRCIRIPIRAEARCLNLSNAAAILTYEALRQLDFPGLTGEGAMKGEAL